MNESLLISVNIPTLMLITITLLAIGVCFFLTGYLMASKHSNGVYGIGKKLSIPEKLKTNISIDETKIVTKINTDDLEKKYDQLAETKSSQENISSSINKLKALKGE
jgi:hypothetical protein